MMPLLEIKNLSVNFFTSGESTPALKNISLEIRRGEIVALVGESGSGKSVTALSILQLLPSPPAIYAGGEINFSENGITTTDLLKKGHHFMQDIRGNKISMIFQEPMTSLNPVISCGEQVMEAILQHKNITGEKARSQTLDWFAKVKLPDPERIFKKYPHQLSGGQKQRVMIAIAMCCRPDILICDEPTTALDVTVQKTILDLIKELQLEENLGVLFITHDLGVVAEIADQVMVMYKGEIVEKNIVREIFQNPQHPYTKALLSCRPVNHPKGERLPVVADFMGNNLVDKQTIAAPKRTNDAVTKRSGPGTSNPVLLKVDQLSVWFPGKKTFFGKPIDFIKAVDNVSFEVKNGETLGLVGESGCGKTTLGRALLRLIEPTAGKILFKDENLAAISPGKLRSLRKEIQMIFQDPYSSLNPRLTIGSAISEPLKVHGLIESSRQRKEKVFELLEKVDLRKEHFNRYPHEFSGGQRQRIVIARALALNPGFLVCDESVSALDVSVQAQVLNLLNDLKKELGFTIVFISHDLSVVRYLSDRIIVMNKGRIEEMGPAEQIYLAPKSDYTRKLVNSIPKGLPNA